MKPLDPRLLKYATAARGYMFVTTATGILITALVVAQVLLVAHIVSPAVRDESHDPVPLIWALAAVFLARVVVLVVQESLAHRASTKVIAQLRAQVLEHAVAQGPRYLDPTRSAEITTLATRGLDDLGPYFERYLPQLVLSATLTPVTLAVVFFQDLTSGLILLFAIPLIPVFMWLVGVLTQTYSRSRIEQMDRLGAQLLDLLAGLTTLKALGRERGPAARVRSLGDAYAATTLQTLRVAFLSSAILEFIASLSVALVAVVVGMRLVYGNVELVTALAAIMLAPEVLMPLRQVGSHFHASTDGIAAAEAAFRILDEPLPTRGTAPLAAPDSVVVRLTDVTVRAPGRDVLAPAHVSATFSPGVTALVGPTGSGKSTTALVLMGLLRPDSGQVLLRTGDREVPLSTLDPAAVHRLITWVPQRPTILPGTVRDNLVEGADVSDDALEAAAAQADFLRVVRELPQGWLTPIGHGGIGLSVGQRQRLALTRAMLAPRPLVVLDEPTAHLDAVSEEVVVHAAQSLAADGRTVVVIAHRQAMIESADRVVQIAAEVLS